MTGDSGNILVIAFDGLDYDLLKEYNCDTFLDMTEFGTVDNTTDISKRVTPELFASFITGKTWQNHGIKGLNKIISTDDSPVSNYVADFERWATKSDNFLVTKTNGLRTAIAESVFDVRKMWWEREDLHCETLFEVIPNSKGVQVPVWSTRVSKGFEELKKSEYRGLDRAKRAFERDFYWSKKRFADNMFDTYNLYMHHFHYVDWMQHLTQDEEELQEMYRDINRFAQFILEQLGERYRYVLFFSDHGVPAGTEHNKNAFYSCNQELFLNDTPHITDFYSKILSITGNGNSETVGEETIIDELTV